jgi:hypothetical protein
MNNKYLYIENKKAISYPSSTQIQAQKNMSFKLHIINYKMSIKLITLLGGSVKSMYGNILGVMENNIHAGTEFIMEPETEYARNFNFYLLSSSNGLYVQLKDNLLFNTSPTPNTLFTMELDKGFYTFKTHGRTLAVVDNNILKCIESPTTNEHLFRIDLQYIII